MGLNNKNNISDRLYDSNILNDSEEVSDILNNNLVADLRNDFIEHLENNGTKQIYDFGKAINENKPIIDKDTFNKIRAECKDRLKKLEEKFQIVDKYDGEFDRIEDVIMLYKDVYQVCQDNRKRNVLDEDTVIAISKDFNKASDEYFKLCSLKGWDL